eukprot:CAMPEP_0183429672 /NCGR_PEP_ID=MMETSP0370-20130417/49030_1 /TAXON_ID=268820 /ORGANISM="Peridinium aciculiferum, Strain PAER-2" /LENGTH=42 /DNA_ID= /DNA_START= /DNA_END= /DNA_ORIENTATION=
MPTVTLSPATASKSAPAGSHKGQLGAQKCDSQLTPTRASVPA